MTTLDTASLTERAIAEIRAELGRQNMTRAGLADRLGVERNWIHYRLSGETSLRVDDVERIAAALGVPISQLLPTATTDSPATVGAGGRGTGASVPAGDGRQGTGPQVPGPTRTEPTPGGAS
jgi:hypothetical protein